MIISVYCKNFFHELKKSLSFLQFLLFEIKFYINYVLNDHHQSKLNKDKTKLDNI